MELCSSFGLYPNYNLITSKATALYERNRIMTAPDYHYLNDFEILRDFVYNQPMEDSPPFCFSASRRDVRSSCVQCPISFSFRILHTSPIMAAMSLPKARYFLPSGSLSPITFPQYYKKKTKNLFKGYPPDPLLLTQVCVTHSILPDKHQY